MRRERWTTDFFFFNDTATTEIYTLSLHDALPIFHERDARGPRGARADERQPQPHASQRPAGHRGVAELRRRRQRHRRLRRRDRKSTRLNSSHANISYAVFCLKKKNNRTETRFTL